MGNHEMFDPLFEGHTMNRYAFRMKLHPGREAEYERRHAEIWPTLKQVLNDAGVRNYTIWLDRPSGYLFALMHLVPANTANELPNHPVVKKWWSHMADIMDTNADNSPVVVELEQVFHME